MVAFMLDDARVKPLRDSNYFLPDSLRISRRAYSSKGGMEKDYSLISGIRGLPFVSKRVV